jgi:hypothetical protein
LFDFKTSHNISDVTIRRRISRLVVSHYYLFPLYSQISGSAQANAVCRAMFHSVKDELLERVQTCFERSIAARESFFTPKGEFDFGVARFSWFALGQQWIRCG